MSNLNLKNRETKLTDAEFSAIQRNDEGRIIWDFCLIWCWLTDDQKDELNDDDWQHGQELDEELRIMWHQEFA